MPPASTRPSLWRYLPNTLTIVRIVLVAPLIWWIAHHRFGAALVVIALAGVTDAVDGFLAKHFGWQTWLGGVLDPLADKLLLVASFVSLGFAGDAPAWLVWLVVGRDVVIAAGASAYHFLIGRIVPQPSVLSKLTTFVQILCALSLLLGPSGWLTLPAPLAEALIAVTAIATVASGLQYVAVWSRKALRSVSGENA